MTTSNKNSKDAPDSFEQSLFEISGRRNVSEEVLQRAISLLKSGHLSPGDRLPPERELAAMMGVSRPSLRQAMGALNLLGVTDTIQGSGTYLVKSLDHLPLEPYLFRLLLNTGSFQEVMEIRQIIEPEVAALAAKRGSDKALREVQDRFEAFEQQALQGEDIEAEAKAGQAFHEALAEASGNATLALLLKSLSDLTGALGNLLVSRFPGASLESHRRIKDAILQRDVEEARRVMKAHLVDVERRLSAALDEAVTPSTSKRSDDQQAAGD